MATDTNSSMTARNFTKDDYAIMARRKISPSVINWIFHPGAIPQSVFGSKVVSKRDLASFIANHVTAETRRKLASHFVPELSEDEIQTAARFDVTKLK